MTNLTISELTKLTTLIDGTGRGGLATKAKTVERLRRVAVAQRAVLTACRTGASDEAWRAADRELTEAALALAEARSEHLQSLAQGE